MNIFVDPFCSFSPISRIFSDIPLVSGTLPEGIGKLTSLSALYDSCQIFILCNQYNDQ